MMDFHQCLVGPLDVLGLGLADNAQRFERPAVLLVQRLDPFGGRLLRLAVAIFGENAKGIAEPVARPQARSSLARGAGAGIAGGKARARLGLGRGMEGFLELFLFHAGEEVEGRIVVADMLEAEMVVLPLAAGT